MVTLKSRGKRGWPAVSTRVLVLFVMCLTTICVYVNVKLGMVQQTLLPINHATGSNSDTQRYAGPVASHLIPQAQQRLQQQFRTQTPVGGAFVHVGKTGGSTLSVLLRNGCHSWLKHPCRNVTHETVASRTISSYYHVADFGLLPKSHHDFYVVTLRNPFDRVISAFCYEHFANLVARNETSNLHPFQFVRMKKGYDECFPTLQDFVMHLDGNSMQFHYPYERYEIYPQPCSDFARAAFHGRIRAFNHLYFNFQRIKSLIPKPEQQMILVTRQEFLWKDWVSVNQFLGQNEQEIILPFNNGAAIDDGSSRSSNEQHQQQQEQSHIRNMKNLQLPVTRDLSPSATQILCKALQHEFDAYFWFIRQAKNLSRQDLIDTIFKARTICPQLVIDFKSLSVAA